MVDPRKFKSVPGRKSGVADCQWLQQLHTDGLLAAAFRPSDGTYGGQTSVLRADLWHRGLLVEFVAEHIRHMQKEVTQMNLKQEKCLSEIPASWGC